MNLISDFSSNLNKVAVVNNFRRNVSDNLDEVSEVISACDDIGRDDSRIRNISSASSPL